MQEELEALTRDHEGQTLRESGLLDELSELHDSIVELV